MLLNSKAKLDILNEEYNKLYKDNQKQITINNNNKKRMLLTVVTTIAATSTLLLILMK